MTRRYAHISEELAATIVGRPEYTSHELAQLAGTDVEEAWRFWRALGFPRVPSGAKVFTRQDLAMLKGALAILRREDADPSVILQIARASGQALSRMADVQTIPIAAAVKESMRSTTNTDADAANSVVAATETLLTTIEPFLSYAWRRHLLVAIGQTAAEATKDPDATSDVIIGFADLVGFTAISQELSHREIAATVDRFSDMVYQTVPASNGRVIKMIGDEVMFVAPTADSAAAIALAIVDACNADELLPPVRVGLAAGPAFAWEGDIYGPAVNLASRLVTIANPGTIITTEPLAGNLEASEIATVRPIRRKFLKGIGKIRPSVIRAT